MMRDCPHSREASLNRVNDRTRFPGSAVVDWVAKLTRSVPKTDLQRASDSLALDGVGRRVLLEGRHDVLAHPVGIGLGEWIAVGAGQPNGVEWTPEIVVVLRVPDRHRRIDIGHVCQGEHSHGLEQGQTSRLRELAHDPAPLDLVELEPPGTKVGLLLAAERAV